MDGRRGNHQTSFEVRVMKEDFKFHAAHFVAFDGFRERLHGHNYKVGVKLHGSRQIASDGYVVDFGDVKKAVRKVCKQLNEHFLCPTLSDVIDIVVNEKDQGDSIGSVTLTCQDGSVFQFPRDDCAMLPIMHATAEELAIYLWSRILEGLDAQYMKRRGVHTMEIIVAEAVGQEAIFRLEIPQQPEMKALDVPSFIRNGEIKPAPCPSGPSATDDPTSSLVPTTPVKTTDTVNESTPEPCNCDDCSESMRMFSAQLDKLAVQLNNNPLDPTAELTGDYLRRLLHKN